MYCTSSFILFLAQSSPFMIQYYHKMSVPLGKCMIMDIIQYENYQERKSHGGADFPYITYPCSIPLDFPKVPLHWHDEMELIYIKKGCGIVSIDFTVYHVHAGDILIVIPGQLHTIDQEPGWSMEYENIIFQLSMFYTLHGDTCGEEYFVPMQQHRLIPPSYLHPGCGCYQDAAACLDHADQLCSLRPAAYQIAVKGQLFQLFFILFSQAEKHEVSQRNSKSLEKTKMILKYMETRYAEKLTIKEMAEACGFSQSHFMKFFKGSMGTSFTCYLNEYRLTMASRLLLSSSASILEVAGETGFDNLSYFNRSFKQMFGMTPREFRGRQR